ncbi:hypothetical protein [Devosia elaeis]|nr:hypothetical protein [Devosia elaeis]
MRAFCGLALAGMIMFGPVLASPMGEQLPDLLYAGTAVENREAVLAECDGGAADACFGLGLIDLVTTAEGLSQALYRHGATTPDMAGAAFFLGLPLDIEVEPANPDPEPLDYAGLRAILEDFVAGLDQARQSFLRAGEAGDYLMLVDPLRVRLDMDGDGTAGDGETLAALLGDMIDLPAPRTKGDKTSAPETNIGFDRADAFWFAGYTQITAAPVDLLLAHDFSDLFAAIGHRFFPNADLPMQDHARGGTLVMDAESDAFFADVIAALHRASFPVQDAERLRGVLARAQAVTELSRRNWEAILAETDDNRELVPAPGQTSLVPGHNVTDEVVEAWMATLDRVDEILAGELLLPHWRFQQGFDLKAYFETATETDLVMLFTGQGALPFLRDGPVADAESFAAGNAVFGENWPSFAIWFN